MNESPQSRAALRIAASALIGISVWLTASGTPAVSAQTAMPSPSNPILPAPTTSLRQDFLTTGVSPF
ncbi:MAG: hypothetical protein KDB27_24360, partial [Planctomycetales bacterium]|nr:hypothetical protein [Planctomycetales bacterium]